MIATHPRLPAFAPDSIRGLDPSSSLQIDAPTSAALHAQLKALSSRSDLRLVAILDDAGFTIAEFSTSPAPGGHEIATLATGTFLAATALASRFGEDQLDVLVLQAGPFSTLIAGLPGRLLLVCVPRQDQQPGLVKLAISQWLPALSATLAPIPGMAARIRRFHP